MVRKKAKAATHKGTAHEDQGLPQQTGAWGSEFGQETPESQVAPGAVQKDGAVAAGSAEVNGKEAGASDDNNIRMQLKLLYREVLAQRQDSKAEREAVHEQVALLTAQVEALAKQQQPAQEQLATLTLQVQLLNKRQEEQVASLAEKVESLSKAVQDAWMQGEGVAGLTQQGEKEAMDAVPRRNFSNSLLPPEPDMYTPREAPAEGDSSDKETKRMDMTRCASLSSLSLVADAKDKSDLRKGRAARKRSCSPNYDGQHVDVPVVIVTSEIAPWSKTGGLAMVAASLTYEFAARGHRTLAISPMYKDIPTARRLGGMHVHLAGADHFVEFYHEHQGMEDGTDRDYLFIAHPAYRKNGGLYCDDHQREYDDNLFRFSLLCRVALQVPMVLTLPGPPGCPLGEKVMFITNDWQAGLVPVYLVHKFRNQGRYTEARCMHVIHNMGHQGKYPLARHQPGPLLGLEGSAADTLRHHDVLNLCKGALCTCDMLVAVSPHYARELQTPAGGFGLHDLVNQKAQHQQLVGIMNGIDDSWDAETDSHIAQNYTLEDFERGKAACKMDLQRTLNLAQDTSQVLLGFVGRLVWQKGVDLIGHVVEWLMRDEGNRVTGHVQLILMGQGEHTHCDMLRWAERSYPGRVCGYVGFDPIVEHKMMAGCDLLLMPSRYEPCGLPQMYCQAYGTIPVVSATGGLLDSVQDLAHNEENLAHATGFHISPITESDIKRVLYRACDLFIHHRDKFKQLQCNALAADYYWPQVMDAYEQHLDRAMQAATM